MNPIPFIYNDYKINQEVKDILANETRPVTVICIVGAYRTGKSYLLNRLMGKNDGFPLGPTVESKTKGIWFWIGDFFDDPSRALILLDTEGLHDTQQVDRNHDITIFILSILLSSVFIYNTKGNIDAKSLDGLHYASEMSSYITANSKDKNVPEGMNLGQHFPQFLWAVRDHHLELIIDDKEVTADQYLEHCLQYKHGKGKNVSDYNTLRESVKGFFPKRSCRVFPVPVKDVKMMNSLETLQDCELNPEFIEAGNQFLQYIKNTAESKKLNGSVIKGDAFAILAESYIKSTLEKNVCIESTYDLVRSRVNEEALKKAEEHLEISFREFETTFPVSDETFKSFYFWANNEATNVFKENALNLGNDQNIIEEFDQKMKEISEKFSKINEERSSEKCKEILAKLYHTQIEEKSENGEFSIPGGYEKLKLCIANLEEDYERACQEQEMGPKVSAVLEDFKENKFGPLLSNTLLMDKNLTEIQRRAEELEKEKKRHEEQAKFAKEESERTRIALEAMQIAHNSALESLEKRIRQENDILMKELKEVMQREFEEMEKTRAQGHELAIQQHKQQIALLNEQINQLRNRPPTVVKPSDPCTIL